MKKYFLFSIFLFLQTILLCQNPLTIPDTLSGDTINLTLQQGAVQFKPGLITNTMGVNGDILGPTIILEKNKHVTIHVNNQLGEPTTLHWHGLHVSPENDGGPHIVIPAGTTWSPSFKVLDWASTHWYHPHLHHHTNEHVLKGIAGFIITRDSAEASLNLPRKYGIDDFPLVVQTKAFDANNQILVLSELDSILMVNATLNPFLDIPAQVVRLRLLNGSSQRYYNFGFTGNKIFHQIASDGGLLKAPVALTRIMLAPGERAEVLIDLSGMEGQNIHLINFGTEIPNAIYGSAQPGMGAGQSIPNYVNNLLNGSDNNVLQLNIVNPTLNPVTSIPTTLINHTPWLESQATVTRNFTFTSTGVGPTNVLLGPFQINGSFFDMNTINFETQIEHIEIWQLTNQSPISHPFHLHGFPFYVLDINGNPPPLNLQGRKDVIHVPAGMGVVRIITKFEDFTHDTLPYMYHCHMLTHEDDGMMGQFLVKAPCTSEIIMQPQSIYALNGDDVQFGVEVFPTGTFIQWQSDVGFGFQNLSNAGQYSGVNSDTLYVSNVSVLNDNQKFRCIIGSGGCQDTSDVVTLQIVNTFTDENENSANLLVFPNPCKNNLFVRIQELNVTMNFIITNNIHKEVKSGKIAHDLNNIDVSELQSGMYFLRIKELNKVVKIIKY